MNSDGRFAPSPTGPLHLGSLRTALVAWLMARSQGSRFLVRIEDLDPDRSQPEFVRAQIDDLRVIGIDWDEPPLRQSERTWLYDDALGKLHAAGSLYPCFCTRAEVRDAASAPHGKLPEGFYPGTCRDIPAAERRRRIEAGDRFALRLRAGGDRVEFDDRLLGPQSRLVDDFVVVRSDGVHAYQLAVVVDDAAQGIGEVVRGADLADSTPRQILLQRLLGVPTPSYAHVPLVLGPEGRRLAKRDRAAALADRHEPPAATLALLAHSLGLASGRDRVESASELVAEFELRLIPRQPVSLV
ncbi:MAG TPA: tRNA glutamyl-Q(34) synthetase GluQRS [Solirubrobacteraceae bacterium]|jgi:glutamyl-tRNA synthetase|nr:tRNA glutamyl-Q(34) synthetase GluQRS [Solirubrobacteraceae bacterium]